MLVLLFYYFRALLFDDGDGDGDDGDGDSDDDGDDGNGTITKEGCV